MTDGPHLPGVLGKQVGPLPLGAWVAVIAGGVAIGYYRRRHATVPTPQATVDPAVVNDTTTNAGIGGYAGPTPVPLVPAVGSTMRVPPATNEEWAHRAVENLIAVGADPYWSTHYIESWLRGDYVGPTGAQAYTVGVAQRTLGPPPQLPTQIAPVAKPSTAAAVLAPTTVRNAVDAPGATAFEVA